MNEEQYAWPAIPTPGPQDLAEVIELLFPEEHREQVRAMLNEYSANSQEPLRVQMAALVLSESDLKKLRLFVDYAKRDYRDVLCFYEYTKPGRKLWMALTERLAKKRSSK